MKEVVSPNNKLATKIRIVRIKDNVTINVNGYKKAFEITGANKHIIQKIINDDNKSFNGYKFYNWG